MCPCFPTPRESPLRLAGEAGWGRERRPCVLSFSLDWDGEAQVFPTPKRVVPGDEVLANSKQLARKCEAGDKLTQSFRNVAAPSGKVILLFLQVLSESFHNGGERQKKASATGHIYSLPMFHRDSRQQNHLVTCSWAQTRPSLLSLTLEMRLPTTILIH